VVPAETAVLVATAVDFVRQNRRKPALLHLTVPRLSGHSSVDNQAYKSEAERAAEWQRDPIPALKSYLVPALMDEAGWAEFRTRWQTAVPRRAAAEATPPRNRPA
jgi:2-oxoisovalerate dehydrogenase E1 component